MVGYGHASSSSAASSNGRTQPSIRCFYRAAFTLTELILVIGLIVLLLGLATAAFNALTNNGSLSGAVNQIAATLSHARSLAISSKTPYGVAFFHNASTDRATMAIVPIGSSGDNGPPDAFAWTKGVAADGTTNTHYIVDDIVFRLVPGDTYGEIQQTGETQRRMVVKFYKCIKEHDSLSAADGPPTNTTNWALTSPSSLSSGTDDDWIELPRGVGAQLINDASQSPVAGPRDRYLSIGLIAFDSTGQLISTSYGIDSDSVIGRAIGLSTSLPQGAFKSQFGIVLYDAEAFKNQPGATDPDMTTYTYYTKQPANMTQTDEDNEETWLANNGTQLTVNRYNASLMRSQ